MVGIEPMGLHALRLNSKAWDPATIAKTLTLLDLNWRPAAIREETGVPLSTIYRWQKNCRLYGGPRQPSFYAETPRRRAVTAEDEKKLLDWLLNEPWHCQDEMRQWLFNERGVICSQPTISRLIKRNNWSRKMLERVSASRNEELRQQYRELMLDIDSSRLIFLDESIFNEKTGWRSRGYAPIGEEARYFGNIRRGDTWAIIAAMSRDDWLPCTSLKKGYYSKLEFKDWITHSFSRPSAPCIHRDLW